LAQKIRIGIDIVNVGRFRKKTSEFGE